MRAGASNPLSACEPGRTPRIPADMDLGYSGVSQGPTPPRPGGPAPGERKGKNTPQFYIFYPKSPTKIIHTRAKPIPGGRRHRLRTD